VQINCTTPSLRSPIKATFEVLTAVLPEQHRGIVVTVSDHEVPGSIPGSTMVIFLEGEDFHGDHDLDSLVELRFKALPGTSYSCVTIHLIGTTYLRRMGVPHSDVGYTSATLEKKQLCCRRLKSALKLRLVLDVRAANISKSHNSFFSTRRRDVTFQMS
jgi:hypothetical protein